MPNHAKCSHPWTVHTSRLLMSQNSIKNVLENLFLMFGRGKTQNRAKTHRPSMSAFSAIFVLKENGTQSHSAKFLNWGDHLNSVPDLAASPPWSYPIWSQVTPPPTIKRLPKMRRVSSLLRELDHRGDLDTSTFWKRINCMQFLYYDMCSSTISLKALYIVWVPYCTQWT